MRLQDFKRRELLRRHPRAHARALPLQHPGMQQCEYTRMLRNVASACADNSRASPHTPMKLANQVRHPCVPGRPALAFQYSTSPSNLMRRLRSHSSSFSKLVMWRCNFARSSLAPWSRARCSRAAASPTLDGRCPCLYRPECTLGLLMPFLCTLPALFFPRPFLFASPTAEAAERFLAASAS